MSTGHPVSGVTVPDEPLADPEVRSCIRELPPSATFVAILLADHAPLTPEAIADRSLLPVRTVRYALERLADERLVETRVHDADARTKTYLLIDSRE